MSRRSDGGGSIPAHPAAADVNRPLGTADVVRLSQDAALSQLNTGEIDLEGQLVHGSNDTFLAAVAGPSGTAIHAIYKPRQGEQPLWDFPYGTLARREVAAFALSEALGWGLVPPTVLRRGPLGTGMVQLFIPHDPAVHFLVLPAPDERTILRLAVYDVVANNADRKSGHVLADPDGRLWAIDHGLTFHVEPKLRTVIWDVAGRPLPDDVSDDLARVAAALADRRGDLRRTLLDLLAPDEVGAIVHRTRDLLRTGRLPAPDPGVRHIPWPPV